MSDGNAQEKQRFLKEEEKQRKQEEVNWVEYFLSIRNVCPWSYQFWMEDKILLVTAPIGNELSYCAAFLASGHQAILFQYPDEHTQDELYAVTEKIEAKYDSLVAFWSHPDEKEQNTPKPCVIVQDKAQLTDLRKQVGYTDE